MVEPEYDGQDMNDYYEFQEKRGKGQAMTQTHPSIRRLAEETARRIRWAVYEHDGCLSLIESALTTLATQIREEDARIADEFAKEWFDSPAHVRREAAAAETIAASIRARQEK